MVLKWVKTRNQKQYTAIYPSGKWRVTWANPFWYLFRWTSGRWQNIGHSPLLAEAKAEAAKRSRPKVKPRLHNPLKGYKHTPPPANIQTLIFSRDQFTKAKAKAWAERNGFKHGGVDTTERSHRLRQVDPEDFVPGSFRTITMTDGVKAVVGHLRR